MYPSREKCIILFEAQRLISTEGLFIYQFSVSSILLIDAVSSHWEKLQEKTK